LYVHARKLRHWCSLGPVSDKVFGHVQKLCYLEVAYLCPQTTGEVADIETLSTYFPAH
jgi:hypothetical protein